MTGRPPDNHASRLGLLWARNSSLDWTQWEIWSSKRHPVFWRPSVESSAQVRVPPLFPPGPGPFMTCMTDVCLNSVWFPKHAPLECCAAWVGILSLIFAGLQ